jgi:hypothetical protein
MPDAVIVAPPPQHLEHSQPIVIVGDRFAVDQA